MNQMELKPSTSTAIWIATALLHRENPSRDGFQGKEIFNKVKELNILRSSDSTLKTHISHHCVAIAKPSPNTDRKLVRLGNGWFRLWKDTDEYNEGRMVGESVPYINKIPKQFQHLFYWYENEYSSQKDHTEEMTKNTGIFKSIVRDDNSIVMPEAVLQHLKAKSGDILIFFTTGQEDILIKKPKS